MTMTKEDIRRWKETSEQWNEIKLELSKLSETTAQTGREVGKISQIVTGNGDPERGLFNQFQLLKTSVDTHHAMPHITKEDIADAVRQALPRRTDIKTASFPEKVGYWRRILEEPIKYITLLITAIILSVGASYIDYDALKDMFKFYQEVQKDK